MDVPPSPPPLPTAPPPVRDGRRFDRDEVSAIIGRALEVAHHRMPVGEETLGVDDLIAIADDVGLSRSAVVTALAEAKAGVDHRRRMLDRLVGPSQVWSISQLPIEEADAAADTLQHWLEIDQGLRTVVTGDGVVVAERPNGLGGAVSVGLRRLGGTGGLDRARRVRGAVASVEGLGSVCVVAEVGNKRAEAVAGGSMVAGGAGTVGVVIGLAVTPFAFLAIPAGALAGLAVARAAHRQHLDQIAGQVEMTTENVVRGHRPEHPVERFLRTRVVRRIRRR